MSVRVCVGEIGETATTPKSVSNVEEKTEHKLCSDYGHAPTNSSLLVQYGFAYNHGIIVVVVALLKQ